MKPVHALNPHVQACKGVLERIEYLVHLVDPIQDEDRLGTHPVLMRPPAEIDEVIQILFDQLISPVNRSAPHLKPQSRQNRASLGARERYAPVVEYDDVQSDLLRPIDDLTVRSGAKEYELLEMAPSVIANLMHHEEQHVALLDRRKVELIHYYHVHAPDRLADVVLEVGILQSQGENIRISEQYQPATAPLSYDAIQKLALSEP
ncbi:MAG: hypothetical protein A4E46_00022 [Methanosaeta sp. PtaU1.Bin016]|nr:MAG: hypothetical protein A4E46_00022 [Methanosaeta sp. PtaU1.Bin016]